MKNYFSISIFSTFILYSCNQIVKEEKAEDRQIIQKISAEEFKKLSNEERDFFEAQKFIISTEINRFVTNRGEYTWRDVENYYLNELPKYVNHKYYKALKDRNLVILLKHYNLPLIENPGMTAKTAKYLEDIYQLNYQGIKEIKMIYNALNRLKKESYWSDNKIQDYAKQSLQYLSESKQITKSAYEDNRKATQLANNKNKRAVSSELVAQFADQIKDLDMYGNKLGKLAGK
jgi:hypothetical protein